MEPDNSEGGKNTERIHFKRLAYLIYAVILINFSFIMWTDIGYLNIPVIGAIWILLGLSCLMIIYSAYNGDDIPLARVVPVVSFFIALYVLLSLMIHLIPAYGTDEIALDSYAAYLTLHGANPYINANMLNVFAYTGFPQNLITPLDTGGSVKYFVYPGLSAIVFLPAVIFKFPPYVILLAFNIAFFVIQYAYYRREKVSESLPLLLVAMVLDAEYSIYSVSGVTDIVWIMFLGLSYIYKKNWKYAGTFFGLALAFKQIPIVILPFYIYFLHRQEGYTSKKTLFFLTAASVAFMIPNIPFIVMNAGAWFSNIILIAYQPILGVGIGPSILSFAGFLYIPSGVFEIALIFSLIIFFYLYLVKFDRLKYAFFAFPVVIFMLNYRTLENYIIYWPFLFLLIIPEVLKGRSDTPAAAPKSRGNYFMRKFFPRFNVRKRLVNFMVVGIIIIGAAASAGYEYSKAPTVHSPFTVMNVTAYGNPYQIPNEITSLTVQMNYTPMEGGPSAFNVYYRIFTNGMINNVNSLLWSGNTPVSAGVSNVTIYPNTASDMLSYGTSFVLEAYYGNFTSFLNVKPINNGTQVYFPNPDFSYPTYSLNEPYPGWKLKTSSGVLANYSYLPFGTVMNMKVLSREGNWTYFAMESSYNFTYMEKYGYNFYYYLDPGLTNVSTVMKNGSMKEFAGVQLSFDKGLEKLWIGFNRSVQYQWYFQDRINQFIVQNSTDINFSSVYHLEKAYNWTFQDPVFSFMIGTQNGRGTYHAYFSDSVLVNGTVNGSANISGLVHQQFNSVTTDPPIAFTPSEGLPVVETNGRTFR